MREVGLLIRIRYSDLPAGLHVRAEASGRRTTIYLLPGLSRAERRAALIRARRSASMGYGPRLPAAGVAAAILLDRMKAAARNGATAFQAHPLLLLPPAILAVAVPLAFALTAATTITIGPPQPGGPSPRPGGTAAPSVHISSGQPADQRGKIVLSTPGPATSTARPGRPASPPGPSRPPGRTASPPPGSASPSPQSPGPPGPGTPSPSPSPSSSGTCLNLGPLGICLHQ